MAATILNPGDIAIVGYITNGNPDSFSFVNLVPIGSDTVIYFSDNGWTGTQFRGSSATDGDGNENLIRFTANSDIPAGTVIRSIDDTSSSFTWTKSGQIGTTTAGSYNNLSLAQGGEQIAAFQSTNTSNPLNSDFTAIYQIDNSGTFEDATSSSTGSVIAGLSQSDNTAVLLNNSTATYAAFNLNTLPSGGTQAQWLAAINNAANWTFGSATSLPTDSISIVLPAPNVQITEYMYSGNNGEFIELTNLSTGAVDMTGWSFDDDSRTPGSFSLSAFGIVQAGESVILTETADAAFRTAWGLSSSVKVIGGLTQNLGRADEINLYDNNGQLIDRLTYGDQTFPGTIRTQNFSGWTEVANLDANVITSNWQLSSVGDAQNSNTSAGGDVGNPGIYVINSTPTLGAPTITVNSTTTNFLDGENLTVPLPITGSGAISGVINDPTDPAKLLGLEFSIADTDTPISNLIVTVSSSNQTIVPNANLTLSGTGASRNLKIDPAGVGLADITVTVSDGTLSNSYVIRYAASAASGTPATSRYLTGTSDASTAIAIASNYMLVADDEDQTIRLYDRNNSGLPLASFDFTSFLGLSGSSEVDIEASTRIGNTIYWMGSHSNNSSSEDRPNRERIFATEISGTGANTTLTFQGYYKFLEDDLIAWDNANGHGLGAGYLGLAASAANGVSPEVPNGFNIEGLTIAPNGNTAYVSFRAPNQPTNNRTQALIIPVTNFTSILNTTGGTTGSATFGAPIQLDLGGRGIRSIERNSDNQYVIVAGPAGAATGTAPNDFRLYTWTGNAADAPVLRSADLTALNTGGSFETIVEVPNSLTGTTQIQLLVDNGDTVWYNNGTISKDLAQDNLQKFRSEIITLGSVVTTIPPGAISLSSLYSQNFDTLSSSNANWIDAQTIPGWYASRTTINAGTGSSNAGSLYSFGATGNSERALGSVASGGTGTIFYGARFFNDTGATLNSLSISYIGEQWRNGGNTTQHQLDFAYQVAATNITSGTWTDADSLDFTGPIATSTADALDGNNSNNRVSLSNSLTGFSLAPGEEIWLRWADIDNTGSDHGLSIDNLQVSTAPLPGVTLIESDGSTSVTEGGATDTYTVVLNTQPTADVIVTVSPDSQATTSATILTFTFANWNIAQTVTVTAVDDALVEGTHSSTISHIVTSSDSNYNDIAIASVTATVIDNDTPAVITKIHEIQGNGSTFNTAFGGIRTIEGIVVRAFPGSSKLNGFYVQEEDADADANAATSEAIFVFDPSGLFSGSVGDKVRVTGNVSEFTSSSSGINSSLTQLSSLTSVVNLGADNLPTVTNIEFPVTSVANLERYEGMLVNISAGTGDLTVTEHFQLGRFGQVLLSATDASNQPGTDARLEQYTQFNTPDVSGYSAYLDEIAQRRIILDDGSSTQNPDPILFARGGNPLSATNTLRGGDTVASITGVLDERFEGYRIQTSTGVNFTPANPRPNIVPDVGGTLKVVSFNVLNYFNGNGTGGGFPTPRGADNLTEFNRQRDKTIAAILGLNADVVGLIEIENDGYGSTSAIQDLVNGLNAVAGAGTYALINPGISQLGTDEIAVGFIYKPGSVTAVGSAATVPDGFGQGAFNANNRKPLAQTFQQNSTGEQFTAVVNHFKSKGSSSGGVGDTDAGDGQGLSNGTRTRAAQDLAAWLATNPTGTTDVDYLIMGDLNAYAQEDPLTTLESAGYNNLFADSTYSYVFDGQWGSLDHALANNSLTAQVAGAEIWHINADEPNVLDYNTNFKSAGQQSSLYNPDAFRASDHDPVIVGLNLNTAPVAVNDTATTNENTAVNINVLANDSDINGDPLQLSLLSTPANGTAVVNNNNTPGNFADDFIIYTPNLNYNGSDSFTYSISDGKGGTATASVSLIVNPVDGILGTPGNDNLIGTNQNDIIRGLAGNDTLRGGNGSDTLYGGLGNDSLNGGNENDTLYGDDGNDTLLGENGNDVLYGGLGNDSLDGGNENDTLYGDDGNDTLLGRNGDDLLVGGKGRDLFTGGNGSDRFYLNDTRTGDFDTITDFSVGQDKILISKSEFGLSQALGTLNPSLFRLGISATAASDRFIYDKTTGNLFFDEDGSGTLAKVQIAKLSNQAAIASTNITVIA